MTSDAADRIQQLTAARKLLVFFSYVRVCLLEGQPWNCSRRANQLSQLTC